MNFKLEQNVDIERGVISQYLTDTMGQVTTWVCDTRHTIVRDALIKLGWTPPGSTGNWISVQDGLPEIGQGVILHNHLGLSFAGTLVQEHEGQRPHWQWGESECSFECVTHWMPMPEGPKAEKGDAA